MLLAVILGSGVAFLDGSVVNLALPKMAEQLGTGFSGQQWIVDGYLLTLSALILLGGSLGDILGRKKVYMWGVAGFGAVSLLCAFAPSVDVLIAARVLQGICGALMIPGALALIDTNFSAEQRGKAIGLWTAATSAIIAAGPLLGGYLIDALSWRWIFLINVPLLLVVVWLGLPAIRESRVSARRTIDWWGAVFAVLALGGVTLGLIEGPVMRWNPLTLAALAVGLVCALLFVWWEHRRRDPMLPLRLFRVRNFTGTNITTFAMYGALGGFFFILTIHLQTVLHYSSMAAGLAALPVSVTLILLSSRIGSLAGKFGPRWFMTAGPIMAGLGILSLLPLTEGAVYVTQILPGILLFGLGMAATVAPLTTTVLASVKDAESGIASGVNNAVSRVSGLFVVAALGIFGAAQAYPFAVWLCGCLAIGAGLLSALIIRNPKFEKN